MRPYSSFHKKKNVLWDEKRNGILGLLIITVISPMGVLNYTITAFKIKNDDVFYMLVTAKISREDIVKGLIAIF